MRLEMLVRDRKCSAAAQGAACERLCCLYLFILFDRIQNPPLAGGLAAVTAPAWQPRTTARIAQVLPYFYSVSHIFTVSS